jgi:hypothetical protein
MDVASLSQPPARSVSLVHAIAQMFGAKWCCLPDVSPYLHLAQDMRQTCTALRPESPTQA